MTWWLNWIFFCHLPTASPYCDCQGGDDRETSEHFGQSSGYRERCWARVLRKSTWIIRIRSTHYALRMVNNNISNSEPVGRKGYLLTSCSKSLDSKHCNAQWGVTHTNILTVNAVARTRTEPYCRGAVVWHQPCGDLYIVQVSWQ